MDLSKNKLSVYSSLGNSKMRRKYGIFCVEGIKSVKEIIGSFELESILMREDFVPDYKLPECTVYRVTENEMKKISNLKTSSPIAAICKLPQLGEHCPEISENELYLMIDGVQDPGNLGTIIRTCHWFGIKNILASKDTVDVFNPKVIQSTMGSLSKVNIFYCDLEKIIRENNEMPCYGLLLDGKNIFKAKLQDRGFIVMGNEGNGISKNLRALISDPLLIPPASDDHSESLNVAVATGITLSIFCR